MVVVASPVKQGGMRRRAEAAAEAAERRLKEGPAAKAVIVILGMGIREQTVSSDWVERVATATTVASPAVPAAAVAAAVITAVAAAGPDLRTTALANMEAAAEAAAGLHTRNQVPCTQKCGEDGKMQRATALSS